MRGRILVVAQDMRLRARLARLLKEAGYGVELAESAVHARRIGLKGFALSVVSPDGLGPEGKGLVAELDAQAVKTLTLATPGVASPGSLDPSDEPGLLARIAEAVRPPPVAEAPEPVLRFGGFQLDLAGHSLTDEAGKDVALTRGEFNLLREFVQRPGRVLSRDQLLQALSGRDAEPFDRSIDVLVGRLRRKIEPDLKRPSLIVTVPGSGYKFAAKVTAEIAAAPVGEAEASRAAPQLNIPVMPERRQLTIVQCSLAGPAFTAARRDPEDLQHLLAVFHEHAKSAIIEAGGTADRLLSDGILAYFGYPQADEHQAERAVRTALRLVETTGRIDIGQLGPLQVRIGIATGLSVVGAPPGQLTALGEVVHLAAGLASRAEPGAVLISANTRRLVGELFELRACAPVAVEGADKPVEAWQVTAEAAAESRFEALRGSALAPLVGREEEMELLLRRWEQAKAGSGRVVLITGEPGIGKSRLIRAFQDAIVGRPHTELRLFCSPHHQDSALHPFIAQLEHAAGFTRDDTDESKLVKLDAVLAQSNATDEAVALIAELLSIPTDQRERLRQASPQARRERTLATLLAQLTGLAAKQPVLVIYEDVHWIDPTSLELLSLSVQRVQHHPVLILLTARPEFKPPWPDEAHMTTHALTRLSRADAATLVHRVAGHKELPGEVMEQILARTDGVPLFVEELTKAVLESGVLQEGEGGRSLGGPLPPVPIPMTLHDSLVARLDRLAQVRDVVQTGAAIGREFSYGLLRAVTALPNDLLQQALQDLVRSELVFCRGVPPEAVYTFKHALVQDAAYATMLRSRRQQLHARIVSVLEAQFPEISFAEPGRLAQHCTEAGLADKAIEYWLAAGRQASACSMIAEAAAVLRKGITLTPNLPDGASRKNRELDLQIALGHALVALHGFGARSVAETYARAQQLCNELNQTHRLLPILHGLWVNHVSRGDLNRARQLAAEMRQLGEARDDDVTRLTACRTSGSVSLFLGDFAEARAYLERGLALYQPKQLPLYVELASIDALVDVLVVSSLALTGGGYLDQARSHCDTAIARARQLCHTHTLAFALAFASWAGWSGRLDPTRVSQYADEMLALSAEHGFAYYRGPASIVRGWCLAKLGQPDQGISQLTAGVADTHAPGFAVSEVTHLTMLADAYRVAGQPDAALATLAEAERAAEATQIRWALAETLRLRGDLLAQTGDRSAVEASFHASIALARRQNAKLFELRAATSLARLWRHEGRGRDACALLAPLCNWFTEGFDAPDLIEAKALLSDQTRPYEAEH